MRQDDIFLRNWRLLSVLMIFTVFILNLYKLPGYNMLNLTENRYIMLFETMGSILLAALILYAIMKILERFQNETLK